MLFFVTFIYCIFSDGILRRSGSTTDLRLKTCMSLVRGGKKGEGDRKREGGRREEEKERGREGEGEKSTDLFLPPADSSRN